MGHQEPYKFVHDSHVGLHEIKTSEQATQQVTLLSMWRCVNTLQKIGGVHLRFNTRHQKKDRQHPWITEPKPDVLPGSQTFQAAQQLVIALAWDSLGAVVAAWDNCLLCSHSCLFCRHKLSFTVQKLSTLEYLFKGNSTACSFWVAGLTMYVTRPPQMQIHIMALAQLAGTLLPCG